MVQQVLGPDRFEDVEIGAGDQGGLAILSLEDSVEIMIAGACGIAR